MIRVKSPDGREWEVRASRFRLPPWRHNDFDPWESTSGLIEGLISFVVLLPIFMVIVPLVTFVVELPVAVVRALLSSSGWVEAVCWYPQRIQITWRVADRHRTREIGDRIVSLLAEGYDGLTFEGVELVEMTAPAGLKDLS